MKATILLIIGLIIIITPISIAIWNVIKSKPVTKDIYYICVISLIIGLPVIMIDRITEIPIPYIGTIKAATEQATSDSQEVSRLRKRIESQSATIDLVAQNASEAKTLSKDANSLYEELSNKNKIADKELKNISDKILPLELKADSLSTLTKKTRKEILRMQERLNIQKLMIASIAGSRSDYEKLNKIAGKKSRIQTYANSAIRNVFFYFMSEKYLTPYPTLVDRISREAPIFSVDEVIFMYHTEDPKRDIQESAINTLAILKRDTAVQEICDSIDREQNLRVISRMTRTLEILTGEKYYPLDIDAVKTWWGKNRDQEKYKPCYKGLLEASAIWKRPSFGSNDYKQVVSLLKQTTEADTNAFYSKCLLGFYYTLLKEFENAEKEFNEVENLSNNNYRWLFLYKALLFLSKDNDINSAITSLNRAMEISPESETGIKTFPLFKDLLENPQLKFPSNKK